LMLKFQIFLASIDGAFKYDRWTGKLPQCNVQKGRMDCHDE
jgi:hypothetical protein